MATLGNNVAGGGTSAGSSDAKFAFPFVLTEVGTVTTMSAYVDNPNASNQLARWFIYSDLAGVPDALQGVTVDTTIVAGQTAGWVTLTYTGAALTPATYWLGIHFGATSNQSRMYVASTATLNYQGAGDVFVGGTNATFGAGSGFNNKLMSIYATYTPPNPDVIFPTWSRTRFNG
jgi:hypothetical protein